MSAALQVANAVARARLVAAAQLIAAGCPAEMIQWWTPNNLGQHCGLMVAGHLAWEAHVSWDTSGEVPIATVKTWWCGGNMHTWVPDPTLVEYWLANEIDKPWEGPRP